MHTLAYQRKDWQMLGIPYICIVHQNGFCIIRLDEYSVKIPVNMTHTKTCKVKFKLKAIHKAYKKVLPVSRIFVHMPRLTDDEKNQIKELFGKYNLEYDVP